MRKKKRYIKYIGKIDEEDLVIVLYEALGNIFQEYDISFSSGIDCVATILQIALTRYMNGQQDLNQKERELALKDYFEHVLKQTVLSLREEMKDEV